MKPLNKNGFTIVETMLFLSISGLLIAGILVGTGTSINTQRYRDSVTSLQSFLQQQYSNVANVSNDNPSSPTNACYGDGSTDNSRGQSECVILGRFISTDDGKTLKTQDVIGYIPSGSTILTDDIDALKQYIIRVSPVAAKSYDLEWGSSVVKPGGTTTLVLSMLVLRSPSSGIIRTFISDNDTVISGNDIKSILSLSALSQSEKLCVESNGLFTGTKLAVFIEKNATSANGVKTLGDDSEC